MLRDGTEWRTLGLLLLCYAIWLFLVINPFGLPLWAVCLLIIPLLTFHSSLQHECLHGHPFVYRHLNDALVFPPLGIFIPYYRFKATHLKHHQNASICDPYDDPESWYQDPAVWGARSAWSQKLFNANNTLIGRMVLGPAIGIFGFAKSEIAWMLRGDRVILLTWLFHGVAAAGLLLTIGLWSDIPVVLYLLCAYVAYSLLMVRTFLEHQAHESMRARSVIIEDKGPFSLLFLNNNLHVVHHAYPSLPWYQLPGLFQKNRERFLKMNHGYRFSSYVEVFRRYAFAQKEPVPYPLAGDKS